MYNSFLPNLTFKFEWKLYLRLLYTVYIYIFINMKEKQTLRTVKNKYIRMVSGQFSLLHLLLQKVIIKFKGFGGKNKQVCR